MSPIRHGSKRTRGASPGGSLPPAFPPLALRSHHLAGDGSLLEVGGADDFAALGTAERVPYREADGVPDEMHAPVAHGRVHPAAGVVAPGSNPPREGKA